jgi:hypothetical protein
MDTIEEQARALMTGSEGYFWPTATGGALVHMVTRGKGKLVISRGGVIGTELPRLGDAGLVRQEKTARGGYRYTVTRTGKAVAKRIQQIEAESRKRAAGG